VGEGVERVIGSEYDLNTLYTYVWTYHNEAH
jgi:hypothetical protein